MMVPFLVCAELGMLPAVTTYWFATWSNVGAVGSCTYQISRINRRLERLDELRTRIDMTAAMSRAANKLKLNK